MTVRPLKVKRQNDFRGNPSGASYFENVPHRHTSDSQWSYGKSVAEHAKKTGAITGTGAIPTAPPDTDEKLRPPVKVEAERETPLDSETHKSPDRKPPLDMRERVLPYVKQISKY